MCFVLVLGKWKADRKKELNKNTIMANVLVVSVNWMGDVIFASPVFRALKEADPGGRLTCMGPARVQPVLESIPFIDEVLAYDERDTHRSPWRRWRFLRELKTRRFDRVFLLHRSFSRALLVFLAGIPQRVGRPTKGRGWLLTHRVISAPQGSHRSDGYLHIVEAFGVPVRDRQTILTVDPEADRRVKHLLVRKGLQETEPFVVINPGGNWALKQWPLTNFRTLVRRLAAKKTARVVVSGAPKDRHKAGEILSSGPAEAVVSVAGEITLKELAALMRRAAVVVSADSGPLHVANAVGTPTVALFGPTRPEITAPRGAGKVRLLRRDVGCNRRACYHDGCPEPLCMRAITVEEVVRAVQEHIR